MDPITYTTLPPAGTILSLTVRRGRVDPMSRQEAAVPACYRLTVVQAQGGSVALACPDALLRTYTADEFNRQVRPHVVAVYAPPPEVRP